MWRWVAGGFWCAQMVGYVMDGCDCDAAHCQQQMPANHAAVGERMHGSGQRWLADAVDDADSNTRGNSRLCRCVCLLLYRVVVGSALI